MSRPIIEVRGLSKRYRLGAIGATSLREEFNRYRDRLRGVSHPNEKEFWALRDVSFDVQPGEVVGIIGRNGAGKSTLLKILSRITEPTHGRAVLRGRVGSLLEVGTGFHPELTGRENIYLNGAILGMSRAEVRQKFDEIVAFAEVEQFIDTPVKRYSSGMYVRLAFAVAAHLEPEILIIDEVLAVGDAAFQKKCIGKMQDVARHEARTILFVSHNLPVVATLCNRICWLDGGRVAQTGDSRDVITAYLHRGELHRGEIAWASDSPVAAGKAVRLIGARVKCDGRITYTVPIDRPFEIEYDFEVLDDCRRQISSSIHVFDDRGTHIMCLGPDASEPATRRIARHRCLFPANFFNAIGYNISIFLVFDGREIVLEVPEALTFEIADTATRGEYFGVIGGAIRPSFAWTKEIL